MKMIWTCIAKVLILFLAAKNADAVQTFAEMPRYTEVNPGEDALLKCRISNKKGVCSWQKDNKPVGIYPGKYEWANENSPVGGDCSIWVKAATLPLDDGQWQCQVTASNYDVPDSLSSPPATLAVREPPHNPRIWFNGSQVMNGQNITISAGSRASVTCEARFGNPPAYIEWYLEKERLTAWSQTNTTEMEKPRRWAARSTLELGATRSAHGRQLECRAHHPSYKPPYYKNSFALLDVTFIPVVSINGADPSVLANLEEGSSALSLECRAEGNPKPYVWWTRNGQVIATNGPKLYLAPVTRNHTGIYGCQARNTLGTSDSVKIEIDIKYPPRVTWVGPDTAVEANLFSQVTLECKADGNPEPSYHWYHNPTSAGYISSLDDDRYPISTTSQLQLHNISYAQHGQYTCVAVNHIGAEERKYVSEPIRLNVLGPPVGADSSASHAWSGRDARVQAAACADPPPRRAVWMWGSLRLEVPAHVGRFLAPEPAAADGCYRYTLHIARCGAADARTYVLELENERGVSSHAVTLTVHETAYVAPIIAAALVIAALLVILLCLIIKCRRRRQSVEYKTDDLDSEKTVLPADAVYSPREQPRVAPPRHAMLTSSVAGVAAGGAASGAPSGAASGAGGGAGARYSPGALQDALTSLEKEAKENVYAVLDPHIQYEITINKHGEPPKYLSLSKPLTHQRTHAFDPQSIATSNEINNNINHNENRFTTFKTGPPKARRSYKTKNNEVRQSFICRSNNDVEYCKDPNFENREPVDIYAHNVRNNENRSSKNYSRMYERNNSDRKDKYNKNNRNREEDVYRNDNKRGSSRSRRNDDFKNQTNLRADETERSFEEYRDRSNIKHENNDYNERPKPGKVREIALRFDRNCSEEKSFKSKKGRPKPLQSYGNQSYLDHIFPDAIEI